MNKKNIILADTIVDKDWEFAQGIREKTGEKWEILCWENAGLKKNNLFNIKRIGKYFLYALKVFLKRSEYDKIISWQQFYGIIFAFYSRLFHVKKKNDLTIMTFIYKPKQGLKGKIYASFMRYVLRSGYIDRIIVFSNSEVAYYKKLFKIEKELFVFLPLGIEKKIINGITDLKLEDPYFLLGEATGTMSSCSNVQIVFRII